MDLLKINVYFLNKCYALLRPKMDFLFESNGSALVGRWFYLFICFPQLLPAVGCGEGSRMRLSEDCLSWDF